MSGQVLPLNYLTICGCGEMFDFSDHQPLLMRCCSTIVCTACFQSSLTNADDDLYEATCKNCGSELSGSTTNLKSCDFFASSSCIKDLCEKDEIPDHDDIEAFAQDSKRVKFDWEKFKKCTKHPEQDVNLTCETDGCFRPIFCARCVGDHPSHALEPAEARDLSPILTTLADLTNLIEKDCASREQEYTKLVSSKAFIEKKWDECLEQIEVKLQKFLIDTKRTIEKKKEEQLMIISRHIESMSPVYFKLLAAHDMCANWFKRFETQRDLGFLTDGEWTRNVESLFRQLKGYRQLPKKKYEMEFFKIEIETFKPQLSLIKCPSQLSFQATVCA